MEVQSDYGILKNNSEGLETEGCLSVCAKTDWQALLYGWSGSSSWDGAGGLRLMQSPTEFLPTGQPSKWQRNKGEDKQTRVTLLLYSIK